MENIKILDIFYYKGNNPFLLNIKKKVRNHLFKMGKKIHYKQMETFIKNTNEAPFIITISKHLKASLEIELETKHFNYNKQPNVLLLKELDVEGEAPYLHVFYNFKNINLSKLEKEYINRNLKFVPLNLKLSITLDDINRKFLSKQFKSINFYEKDKIAIDYLIGETKQYFHVKTKNKYFWVQKTENTKLYQLRYSNFIDTEEIKSVNKYIKADWELKNYQLESIKYQIFEKNAYCLLEQGLGKTATSIAGALFLSKYLKKDLKVLVVCRSTLKINWSREISNFQQSYKIIEKNWIEDDKMFTVISRDLLKKFVKIKAKQKCNNELIKENYDLIIVDEVQDFKGKSTQRAKALAKIISTGNIEYVWGLSGTLFETNEELFNIFNNCKTYIPNLIDNYLNYHQYHEAYKYFVSRYSGKFEITKNNKTFFINKKVKGKKIINTNSLELRQIIKHKFFIRKKTDVLDDFVKKYRYPIYFKLSILDRKKYIKLYDEYEKERIKKGLNKLEDGKAVVEAIIMRKFLAEKKLKYTIEFIKDKLEDGAKIIIFTHFKEELETILKTFGDICVEVNANKSNILNQKAIDEFQTNEKIRIICGNILTLGTGHNLTEANTVIFNSPDWNSGEEAQGEDRAWRLGQKEDVYVYNMLFEDTIEEDVFNRAIDKKTNNKLIFNQKD